MNITIQNIEKCVGEHICANWYVVNAGVIAGYYLWDLKDLRTDEIRRIILNRNVEPDNRLQFVHTGEHAHVVTKINKAALQDMMMVMHKLADELYFAETIFKLQF
jgi:predicted esterase YcpF (UPF0227 family)